MPVSEDVSHTGYRLRGDATAYRGWTEVPDW